MSMSQESSPSVALDRVIEVGTFGIDVVKSIRRLVVITLISAFVYGVALTASRGFCAGGVAATGGFVDSTGHPTDVVPQCFQLTLGPSPFIFAAMALIVVVALDRVIARAHSVTDAVRIVDRTVYWVVGLAAASIVISHLWFWLMPTTGWGEGTGLWITSPFPFGAINLEISQLAP
jgi:hypothetical protein